MGLPALQQQKIVATIVCRHCKSALNPRVSFCVACGYLHVTIEDLMWAFGTGGVLVAAFIGFVWLLGALL